jgi:hypothetical protein
LLGCSNVIAQLKNSCHAQTFSQLHHRAIAELETEKNEAATKITELEKAIATSTEQASAREAELKARIAELEAANCIIV